MPRVMKYSGVKWIGEIPFNWNTLEIKYYCDDVFAGGTPSSTMRCYWDGDIPWLPSGCCHNNKITEFTKTITQLGYEKSSTKKIPAKTVLVAMTGATCGNTGYLMFDSCANQSVTAFIEKKDICNSLFLWYVLQAAKVELLTKQSGGAQGGVNVEDCKNLKVPLVPLDEQRRIANFLDSKCQEVDNMLAKTRSSIEEYKKLKQAIITKAVTKGIRKNRKMKDSGIEWIGEIPEEWETLKLKYVSTISRGLFNHRPRNDEKYYNGEYPFIQTGDVAGASKIITSYSQTLNELGASVSKCFPKGTLTMTIAANVGDVAILGFDAYFPDSVLGIIPKKCIDVYLYYILKSMKQEFVNNAIISTQLNLNIERTKEMFIPYSRDLDEQKEIIDYLDDKCTEIDTLISKKEQLISELESYKKSLIYEYVTGKKEVPMA